MSIKRRLLLGLGLFLPLIFLPLATLMVARYNAVLNMDIIVENTKLQILALEMDRGLEKARCLHGLFFLDADRQGLATESSADALPFIREQMAQIGSLSESLQAGLARVKDVTWLSDNQVHMSSFLFSTEKFSRLSLESLDILTKLHAPERGLQSQLEQLFDAMNKEVHTENLLHPILIKAHNSVLQYWDVPQRPMMESAARSLVELRQQMQQMPLLDTDKQGRITALLSQGTGIIEKIITSETTLTTHLQEIARQVEVVEQFSLMLVTRSKEEVRKAELKLSRMRIIVPLIMALVSVLGLGIAFMLYRMINAKVLRRVARLTEVAGAVRAGNLDISAPEDDHDELGELSRAFNLMTTRLKDAITTLETQVKERTAELSSSEKQFRQLFEHSSSGIVVYEACDNGEDFIIKNCNEAVLEMERRSRQELIGHRATSVFPGLRPFGLLEVMQTVWKNGRTIRHPTSLYVDDKVQGWRENSVYKIPSGEIVCVYDDRTAQKQAEAVVQGMEQKMQRIQKMEALGLMAGGVAHDLNNILSGVVGFPDVLLMHLPPNSPLIKLVITIKESGLRAAAVVADLLTVARGVDCKKEMQDLGSLVSDYLQSSEYQAMSAKHPLVHCASNLAPQLPPIYCAGNHIRNCLLNLIGNAMEATAGRGQVLISTRFEQVDDKTAFTKKIRSGNWVVLEVYDNGKMIAEKDLERIFEPFYSKKVMGVSGTGLGLAVVWSCVADHGGSIFVESDLKGTHFHLYFPVTSGVNEKPVAPGPGSTEAFQGRGETVLVVDDEEMLRDLAGTMLEQLGYTVKRASSGEEAVAYLRENPTDLLILDMIMPPGINGRETYEQILAFAPAQKAIFVSGFAESIDLRVVQSLGARGFVKKPYSLVHLAQAVRKELDGE